MLLNKILLKSQNTADISYAAVLTALLTGFVGYVAVTHFRTSDTVRLPSPTAALLLIAAVSIWGLAQYYSRRLAQRDYKISIQLQNICFALLFIAVIIIGTAVMNRDLSFAAAYVYFILAVLAAVFWHANRSLQHARTGHLLSGVVTLNLLSGFIPIALCYVLLYILPLPLLFAGAVSLDITQRSVIAFAIALPLALLYFLTPYSLAHHSRKNFIRLACVIQFLLLPLYLSVIPALSQSIESLTRPAADGVIVRVVWGVIVPLMGFAGVLIWRRTRDWFDDANLLARDAFSPFALGAILIFLKTPIVITALPATAYLQAIALPIENFRHGRYPLIDFWPQVQGLDYLPGLLLKPLLGELSVQSYLAMLPFAALLLHLLLLLLNFWVLNRFLPQLFVFAILFAMPAQYPELLLMTGYIGLLFDRKLLQNPTLWSALWFGGGIVFLLLAPLYALFLLLGCLPYAMAVFGSFYLQSAERTRNLILLYGFLLLAGSFSDFIQKLSLQIFDIIAAHWLFGARFDQWLTNPHSEAVPWFYHLAFPVWLGVIGISVLAVLMGHKRFGNPLTMAGGSVDWFSFSGVLTLLFSLPVIGNVLIGFESPVPLIDLFYMLFGFAVPMILFRGKHPQIQSLRTIACAASLWLVIFARPLPLPEFTMLLAHIPQ